MADLISGTKFQSITLRLAVFFSFLYIYVVLGEEGTIGCSVESVEQNKDTTLGCQFPENLNVSKKDFTIYHYGSDGTAESVVDCWWIKGNLDCYTKSGFEYNKKVNRTLTVTIRTVTSSHLGNYACQVSGYGANLLTFCRLQLRKGTENTCSVKKEESQSSANVTCHFSEDIGKTQRNFTVFKYNGQNMTEVTKCWWVDGQNQCEFADGYINISRVSSNYTVLISEVKIEKEVNYSCWHSGLAANQKTCLLYLSDREKPDEEQSSGILVIVLIPTLLGVAVVGAIVLFLTYRRKCFSSSEKRSEDPEELTPMTSLMEKEEKERKKLTEDFQEYLVKSVQDMYPDTTETFYFVPPVYFNKTRYKTRYRLKEVTKEVTWVPDAPTDDDVRHDRAMQHVIHCLRHFAKRRQEKMFVLTQLTFDAYLNNVGTEYVRHLLPTADSNNGNNLDLLIIHQKHGVLVGVVKAVSDDDVRSQSNQQKADEMIIVQVREGLQQLDEAVCTMNHLTSDQKSVKVRKALMLPRLSRSSLKRAVDSQPDQFANCSDTEMFLCADDLSDSNAPWQISSDQFDKLVQWWDKMMDKTSDDLDLAEELYLKVISRFFGPATQPSLETQDKPFLLPKTLSEAVSVTGDLYNRPTLSQEMFDLLKEKRVFLVGPPNTCKTRLLTLVGKKWITSGHELHVFCGSASSCTSLTLAFREELRPASVVNDNEKYLPNKANVKHLYFDNEKKIDETVRNLTEQKREQNVYVIADEADVDGKYFRKFCESLKSKCPDVHLWATSSKGKTAVDGWQVKILTTPLHCPPAVVRECPRLEASYSLPEVTNTQLDNFYPTDGPPVKYIYHKKDSTITSHDCKECGKQVAIFLLKHLITRNDTNVAGHTVLSGPSTANFTKITVDKTFSVLQDKDLLVLFESGMKHGEKFVEGLRESGIAVDTVRAKDDQDVIVEETGSACAMHVDQLCKYRPRRKIVVYVENSRGPSDLSLKWRAMTSCTSQLIVVPKNR